MNNRFSSANNRLARIHSLSNTLNGIMHHRNNHYENFSKMQPRSNETLFVPFGNKKVIVKNFKQRPIYPRNFVKRSWTRIKIAIIAIQESVVTNESLEELCQLVQDICVLDLAPKLYVSFAQLADFYVRSNIEQFLKIENWNKVTFLISMSNWWLRFLEQLQKIENIFLYLDRNYIAKNPHIQSTRELCFALVRRYIGINTGVQQSLLDGLLLTVSIERHGSAMLDNATLKNLCNMMNILYMYKTPFEEKLLRTTSEFYDTEARMKFDDLPLSQYIRYAAMRISQENIRIRSYLEPCTRYPLITTVQYHIVLKYLNELLYNGFEILLSEDKYDEICLLYGLLNGLENGVIALLNHFDNFVREKCLTHAIDPTKEKTMVETLYQLHRIFDHVINFSFNNDESFRRIFRNAFLYCVNKRGTRSTELFLTYVDTQMRTEKSNDEESDDDEDDVIETNLSKIVSLLRYVSCKETFEFYYRKALSKRLLVNKIKNFKAEISMVKKLRAECGPKYTQKMEGMFKDIEMSRKMQQPYNIYKNAVFSELRNTEFNVSVLSPSLWPVEPADQVKWPHEMLDLQASYSYFYRGEHKTRKLLWQPNWGTCVLKYEFEYGTKKLIVSTYQSMILLLFNSKDVMGFQKMQAATNIDSDVLLNALIPLVSEETPILLKAPSHKPISKSDYFYINKEFTHNKFTVRVQQLPEEETVFEFLPKKKIKEDHRFNIDAGIIRIMKKRRTLKHPLLLTELYSTLGFIPNISDIKTRIEALIDLEYIKRDIINPEIYRYCP